MVAALVVFWSCGSGVDDATRKLCVLTPDCEPCAQCVLGLCEPIPKCVDSTPEIINAGPGCPDNYCIWINGRDFEDSVIVDVRPVDSDSVIGKYYPTTTRLINFDSVAIVLATSLEKTHFAGNGLMVWVVNPIAKKWSSGFLVKR